MSALCHGRERARWHPGWDVSVRGGWDPPCHQCHSVCSQGNAALTSAPTEFRQVTGCPVAEAIDSHPVSDYPPLSSSKNPHRLEAALYSRFRGRSLEDWRQIKLSWQQEPTKVLKSVTAVHWYDVHYQFLSKYTKRLASIHCFVHRYPFWRNAALPAVRPTLRTSLYRQ